MNLAHCELSYCFLLLFFVSSWVERNLIKIIKKHCNKANSFQWLFCHLTVPEIKSSPRWFDTYLTLLVGGWLPYLNCPVICTSVWLFRKMCVTFDIFFLPFFVSECLSWPYLLQCHVSVMVCPVPSLHRVTQLYKTSSPNQATLSIFRLGLDWPMWPCTPATPLESLEGHARGSTVAVSSIL